MAAINRGARGATTARVELTVWRGKSVVLSNISEWETKRGRGWGEAIGCWATTKARDPSRKTALAGSLSLSQCVQKLPCANTRESKKKKKIPLASRKSCNLTLAER